MVTISLDRRGQAVEPSPLTFPAGPWLSPPLPSVVGGATSGLVPIAQDASWLTVATVL